MTVVRDPGAQPERTHLAWRRTTLAATIALVLGLRHQLVVGAGALGWIALGLLFVGWCCLLVMAHARLRQLLPAQPRPASGALVRTAGLSVVALAVAGGGMLVARSGG